ncbi:MAG TPA: serine hydrolase [Geobacter sp.]|nr:serine hydrolase [Geobacter sp.]
MRIIFSILMLATLLAPSASFALVDPLQAAPTANLDLLLDRAISENLIAGGVIVVGNHEGILATSARGQVSSLPGAPDIGDRTVFDVASLTKVIATTPAVVKLLDEGRINLSDPLSRWFPELSGTDKGEITILHLMTHTSGLSDVMVGSDRSVQGLLRKVATQRLHGAGINFDYADVNFILLGELVHRVSGETLDQFCKEQIYDPLGTRETQFLPRDLTADIAPTSGTRGGVVQDENARRLGGVAGHAGLFSSANDLSRYARLLLAGGILDGKRILSEQVVAQMTTPYLCNNGKVKRALGWDVASPYSAPKGNFFSEASFGHTGYSGSSIWIDPQNDIFVILLTRRMDYRNVHDFNQLRRDVSSFAAVDFRSLGDSVDLTARLSIVKPKVLLASAGAVDESLFGRKAAVRGSQKPAHVKSVARCSKKSSKSSRMFAKAHGGRHSRIGKLARNDAGKSFSSKKRRALPRS